MIKQHKKNLITFCHSYYNTLDGAGVSAHTFLLPWSDATEENVVSGTVEAAGFLAPVEMKFYEAVFRWEVISALSPTIEISIRTCEEGTSFVSQSPFLSTIKDTHSMALNGSLSHQVEEFNYNDLDATINPGEIAVWVLDPLGQNISGARDWFFSSTWEINPA